MPTKSARAKKPKRGAQPGNTNALGSGFYSDQFSEQELALIAAFISDPTLDDELWAVRVANRRVLAALNTPDSGALPADTLTRLVEALAVGTGRVARLLRDKRALSGEAADGISAAVSRALDELGSELGLQL